MVFDFQSRVGFPRLGLLGWFSYVRLARWTFLDLVSLVGFVGSCLLGHFG